MLKADNIPTREECAELIAPRFMYRWVDNHRKSFGRAEEVIEGGIFAETGIIRVDGLEGRRGCKVEIIGASPDHRTIFFMEAGELEGETGADAIVIYTVETGAGGELRSGEVL